MRFVLEIKLGNDAIQTWGDIRRTVCDAVEHAAGSATPPEGDERGKVYDDNGNCVGSWKVVDDA
jgi:hypothetical protein